LVARLTPSIRAQASHPVGTPSAWWPQ
jgi:hypothetical protein